MRFVETWTSATLVATRDLTSDIREFLIRPEAPVAGFAPGSHINVGVTVEVAHRVADAGLTLLAIDSPTVELQTQGNPLRMSGDVHPILLGHTPPVFILEAVAGDRLASQLGFVPLEGMLEVIPRRANAKGADAAPARVFLSFYRGSHNHQELQRLIAVVTPKYLYG